MLWWLSSIRIPKSNGSQAIKQWLRSVRIFRNANMLTKALIDRLINKVYVFPGDRIGIEYATQDFLETKESEKEV